jgi:hypothetical protein
MVEKPEGGVQGPGPNGLGSHLVPVGRDRAPMRPSIRRTSIHGVSGRNGISHTERHVHRLMGSPRCAPGRPAAPVIDEPT